MCFGPNLDLTSLFETEDGEEGAARPKYSKLQDLKKRNSSKEIYEEWWTNIPPEFNQQVRHDLESPDMNTKGLQEHIHWAQNIFESYKKVPSKLNFEFKTGNYEGCRFELECTTSTPDSTGFFDCITSNFIDRVYKQVLYKKLNIRCDTVYSE